MNSPKAGSLNNLKDSFNTATVYYGVYTPNDNKDYSNSPNVFQDKLEALKVAKKNKKSRFKPFQFYHEAAEFSLNGSEFPNNNTTVNGSLHPKIPPEPTQTIGEKASPFKGPKPQELVELRKAIENGNYKAVKDTIWQNPRYLVSSGDTPSILQEGPRYNALHVAAKAKNAQMTELVLMTVSNTEFIKLLYGDDNQQNAEHRTSVLLDLYLNTPNKGLNETPLHFASKYGAPDVVEILVSYPQCDRTLKNKFQKTADQIICERAEGDNLTGIRKKIEILLQDSYYVPVLRTEDNSMPPVIGVPFSPTSPPVLNRDPLSPRLEIHAYAGPMNKKGAEEFRRVWKTPPRSLSFSSPNKRKPTEVVNVSALRFKDPEKGLERIGKKLASKYDVNWKEYWPFLDSFLDIASDEGLDLLEAYLSNRYAIHSKSFAEEVKKTPPVLNRSDLTSPISDLCAAFSACRLNDSVESQGYGDQKSDVDSVVYIDKACQVFANRISNDILYIWCGEHNTLQVLETEIKQLELLITSYMDDFRFSSINFQKIHSRLGGLIGQKLCDNIKDDVRVFLCDKIGTILDKVTKSVDCFSSDDEGHSLKKASESRKPTIYKKQLICLIHYILNVLCQNYDSKIGGGDECARDWENAEACSCVYHVRKAKKNSLSRSSSFRNNAKAVGKNEPDGIAKKLCFDNNEGDQNFVLNGINLSLNNSRVELSSDDDDDDQYYTPPSSPSLLVDVESEDEFNDTELPEHEVFIEGDFPTKLDCEVFNAICYSECALDSNKYPNIYRWHHCLSLYSAAERESWPSSKDIKAKPASPISSSFSSLPIDSPKTSTPSKSWLRITGSNSPRAIFKSYSKNM